MNYYIFTQYEDGIFYDPTPYDSEDNAWDVAVLQSSLDGLNRWVQSM